MKTKIFALLICLAGFAAFAANTPDNPVACK